MSSSKILEWLSSGASRRQIRNDYPFWLAHREVVETGLARFCTAGTFAFRVEAVRAPRRGVRPTVLLLMLMMVMMMAFVVFQVDRNGAAVFRNGATDVLELYRGVSDVELLLQHVVQPA